MKHASRVLLLALCSAPSIFCNPQKPTWEEVSKGTKEAAAVFIDWGITQMHKYPAFPGIVTAALIAKGKESVTLKRSSIVIWGTIGALVFAEPYHLFAQKYLSQRNAQKKDPSLTDEFKKAAESAKVAGEAIVAAAQKGSKEVIEKVSDKIDELTGNNSK